MLPEPSRLRRTLCSSQLRQVLRQLEPWPPRRQTWQPLLRRTRLKLRHRPRRRRPCWCIGSPCTTGRRQRAPSRRDSRSSSTTRCSATFTSWWGKEWAFREYLRTGKWRKITDAWTFKNTSELKQRCLVCMPGLFWPWGAPSLMPCSTVEWPPPPRKSSFRTWNQRLFLLC